MKTEKKTPSKVIWKTALVLILVAGFGIAPLFAQSNGSSSSNSGSSGNSSAGMGSSGSGSAGAANGAAGFGNPSSATGTSSSSGSGQNSQSQVLKVRDMAMAHWKAVVNGNQQQLNDQYASGAEVKWEDGAGGLNGTYQGPSQISDLWKQFESNVNLIHYQATNPSYNVGSNQMGVSADVAFKTSNGSTKNVHYTLVYNDNNKIMSETWNATS